MKTLSQFEMNDVSGAGGFEGSAYDFTSYEDFGSYLGFVNSQGVDPLSFPGAREAFTTWCKGYDFNPASSAARNGWTY